MTDFKYDFMFGLKHFISGQASCLQNCLKKTVQDGVPSVKQSWLAGQLPIHRLFSHFELKPPSIEDLRLPHLIVPEGN